MPDYLQGLFVALIMGLIAGLILRSDVKERRRRERRERLMNILSARKWEGDR